MLKRIGPESGFKCLIFDRSMLAELLPHWHDICRRSTEDNAYYMPQYALSLLETVDADRDVKFVTVWADKILVALLPVVVKSLSLPGLTVAGRAWQTDYTFGCMPLLDRNHPFEAAIALVKGLASLKSGEWVLPQLNANGPTCQAITDALDSCGAPWAKRASFERASIKTGISFDEHMAKHVGTKRRRNLSRSRRRLEELGSVVHSSHSAGPELDRAVEDFLAIEAAGWKGKRGTALACSKQSNDFAHKAFGSSNAGSICRVDILRLNDQPIATGVMVFSGTTGFTVKGAYDENFAGYSAGLLLEIEVIKSFLTEKWAARLDAATSGSHVIDYLWPDRTLVSDLVFSLSPIVPGLRLATYGRVRGALEKAKVGVKRLLRR